MDFQDVKATLVTLAGLTATVHALEKAHSGLHDGSVKLHAFREGYD